MKWLVSYVLCTAEHRVMESADGRCSICPDLLRYSEELSKPRRGITEIDPGTDARSPVDTPAVEQLKRTCVRLCGIAAYEQKEAQDAIRESGALVAVLGMCQINDANPSEYTHLEQCGAQ